MRPLAPPSIALAAVLLSGAALAGPDLRSTPERGTRGASGAVVPERSPPPSSPGFFTLPSDSRILDGVRGDSGRYHEFRFTRVVYSGSRGFFRGRGTWATDFPQAEYYFTAILDRVVDMDVSHDVNPVRLDDPALRRFPVIYALEVGYMRLSPPEVRGLRDFLTAGGFLIIDDFWGPREWANFEREMERVLPGRPIEEIPLDHPIFHQVWEIDEVVQVPGIRRGGDYSVTWQNGGVTPRVRGIFDDRGRLMVVINFNTDLGDAWEWAESPYYPLEFSSYASKMGVNMIVYGMSH